MGTLSRATGAGKPSGASNLLARCMELTEGHAHAALLLMRILFWMPKATVRHGGHTFVAKSREEWAVEAGISFDQCKRAFAELRRRGLVATEQHKFGGKNVTHVRVTGRALALLPTPGVGGGSAPPERRKPAPPERCTSAPLSTQGETDREKQTGEDCVLPHAGALGKDSGQGDSGEEESNEAQAPSRPVEPHNPCPNKGEIVTTIKLNPLSLAVLEQIWQTRIAESYGGFVPNWTSKERGQMGHFRKGCPPGAARAVLEAVLSDWPLFLSLAKSNAGAWNLPARPNVGFLVKFAGHAVSLWQAKTKPKVQPLPKPHLAAVTRPRSPAQPAARAAQTKERAPLEEVMAALCRSPSVK